MLYYFAARCAKFLSFILASIKAAAGYKVQVCDATTGAIKINAGHKNLYQKNYQPAYIFKNVHTRSYYFFETETTRLFLPSQIL